MGRPLVTIGITTFNAASSIESAIDSAIKQTWRPFEIIVSDDNSTDDTLKIIQRKQAQYQDFKFLIITNKINRGVAASRNRIIKRAAGEFLFFFDDDDISDSNRVAKQCERLISYEQHFANGNSLLICHSARKIIYPNGSVRIEPTIGQTPGILAPFGEAVARRILLGEPLINAYGACPTCSQMGRLSTYKIMGGFDEHMRRSEDTEFNIRLALSGGHFIGVAQPLVTQVMTKTFDKSLNEEYRNSAYMLKKHKKFIEKFGLYSFCCKWLVIKYLWLDGQYLTLIKEFIAIFLTHPIATAKRIFYAINNLGVNISYKKFHKE